MMFKSKTLFIVGAGASCEAGLPSGEALKNEIASLLDIRFDEYGSGQKSGDYRITEALREAVRHVDGRNGDINPYLHKAWRIRDVVPSAAISIDNFLDAHRGDAQMELCGKLGIVKSILDAEHASKLKPERDDPNGRFNLSSLANTWYVGLLNMLTEGVAKREAVAAIENVTIITFNYDRCIEQFLAQGLADYYDLTPSEGQAIVSAMPIYHPYGSVGPLPWQQSSASAPFGSQRGSLLPVARRIKTFTEGLADDSILAGMRDAVSDAETVVFLGFAFHPLNMELLTPGHETSAKRVYATSLGLSDSDESVIEADVLRLLGKHNYDPLTQLPLKLEMEKMACGSFFKHYFRSLSAPIRDD